MKEIFFAAVETNFTIFADAVKQASYVISGDDGFDDNEDQTITVRAIVDVFSQDDVTSKLYSQAQPTDVKVLIPGVDVTFTMSSSDTLIVDNASYIIVDFETDPYKALYTLLARKG